MSNQSAMRIDKNLEIRNLLLRRIESGEWPAGAKLPGSRRLAGEVGCSFTHFQTVIESLVQQGILESRPRSGHYVRENWEKRLIQKSLRIYNSKFTDCLQQDFRALLDLCPDLWVTSRSERAIYEIVVSHYFLGHHTEYMDLAPIFHRLFPDRSLFFRELLENFYIDGKLYGIPILFSPRILVCNRRMFREAGVPLPRTDWSWAEFLDCIRQLRRSLPPERVHCFNPSLYTLFSYAARFGANLLGPGCPGEVCLDQQPMLRALDGFLELRDILGERERVIPYHETAVWLTTRQELHRSVPAAEFGNLHGVRLPLPPNGCDVNVPGVELFCVRNECADLSVAERLIETVLSSEVQDHIGRWKRGIPLRRASAARSFDPGDSADALFREEMSKPVAAYHITTAETYNILSRSIIRINAAPRPEAFELLCQLGSALRFLLHIAR